MQNTHEKVLEFLKKHSMTSDKIDIAANAHDFVEEMKNGLDGKKSSLRMIPTYFCPQNTIPAGKKVIVLDAGGTNLRAASLYFDNEKVPHIDKSSKTKMPGIEKEITDKELFSYIANFVKPFENESDTIAFCFSFASIPTPERDGIVDEVGKQVKVTDIVGKSLAKGLNAALKEIGCKEKHIVVLNDSVTTLLGGALATNGIRFSGYIGFILGTGLNASYIESTDNITKLNGAKTVSKMIINTESGDYCRFPRGELDELYDKNFKDCGTWKFEKMTSGRYQGGLIETVIEKAAEEGLFSDNFKTKFEEIRDLKSFEIDRFLENPNGDNPIAACCSGDESNDALTVYYIIDEIIERAAKVTAACFAALILKSKAGTNPLRPVCITCDGSTFYKSVMFRAKLEYYLRKCVTDEMGLYWRLNKVEDVNLIGSALGGLCC